MSQSILKDAWKDGNELIYVEPAICKEIQKNAVFLRYPGVPDWHQWWSNRLVKGEAVIQSSFGHKHIFHGRKTELQHGKVRADHAMLKSVLSTEPQLNTTYAEKMALWRLWNDPENRRP